MSQLEAGHGGVRVERTLALIKPDAVHKAEEIEELILKSGFTILQGSLSLQLFNTKKMHFQKRTLQLSPEECSDFYADHYGKNFFPSLAAFMSSGPVTALDLAREDAIAHWKTIIGPVNIVQARDTQPECLRAMYGISELCNAVHGSDTFIAAERELKYMFPNSVIEPVPTVEAAKEYLIKYVNPTLLRGLTELCKEKPLNPCTWIADWLIKNNPNKPNVFDGAIVEETE